MAQQAAAVTGHARRTLQHALPPPPAVPRATAAHTLAPSPHLPTCHLPHLQVLYSDFATVLDAGKVKSARLEPSTGRLYFAMKSAEELAAEGATAEGAEAEAAAGQGAAASTASAVAGAASSSAAGEAGGQSQAKPKLVHGYYIRAPGSTQTHLVPLILQSGVQFAVVQASFTASIQQVSAAAGACQRGCWVLQLAVPRSGVPQQLLDLCVCRQGAADWLQLVAGHITWGGQQVQVPQQLMATPLCCADLPDHAVDVAAAAAAVLPGAAPAGRARKHAQEEVLQHGGAPHHVC
jgi:hypothetical protein